MAALRDLQSLCSDWPGANRRDSLHSNWLELKKKKGVWDSLCSDWLGLKKGFPVLSWDSANAMCWGQ